MVPLTALIHGSCQESEPALLVRFFCVGSPVAIGWSASVEIDGVQAAAATSSLELRALVLARCSGISVELAEQSFLSDREVLNFCLAA